MNRRTQEYSETSFVLGLLNGVFWSAVEAVMNSYTVIPVFISKLTPSNFIVGLTVTLSNFGWSVPQLFTSNLMEHRPYKMPFYKVAAYGRVISCIIMTVLVYALGAEHPRATLVAFLVFFTAHSLAGGLAGPAFMDIVGKVVAPHRMSAFWARRMFFGGIVAVALGFLVKYTLAEVPFPENFTFLFLIGSLSIFGAVTSFALINEPAGTTGMARKRLAVHLKDSLGILRSDVNFQRLLAYDVLLGFSAISFPFLVVFAKDELHMAEGIAGTFLSVQIAGGILSNLFWERVGAKRGNWALLKWSALVRLAVPFLAIVAPAVPTDYQPYLLGVGFFAIGASFSGLNIGYSSVILEIAEEDRRPSYTGFMSTLYAPVILVPALGGAIVDVLSFQWLFLIAIFFSAVALFVDPIFSLLRKR